MFLWVLFFLTRHHLHFSFTDAPSLCYNFSLTTNGQPWCDVQGQVNGTTFLHYNCSHEGEPIGPLGMEVHDPEIWMDQIGTLKELMEELKKQLLDIKAQISSSRSKLEMPRVEVEHLSV